MYNSSFKGDVCSHKYSVILDNFIRRLFQNPKKIIGPYIKPGDTIIDLGCGPGFFSIEMADLVGEKGRVISVDLQEEMLGKLAHKAVLRQISGIIRPVQCTQTCLNLPGDARADFILAYYMVHETPDFKNFFSQAKAVLKPGGLFLVVEPPIHVSKATFARIEEAAVHAGFSIKERPRGKGGKSILLTH